MIAQALPDAGASLLERLRRTEGVQDVELSGTRVTLAGDRRMIAHVGAALVSWGPVPPDLGVHVPDLEDALLRLLENDQTAATPSIPAQAELIGGRR